MSRSSADASRDAMFAQAAAGGAAAIAAAAGGGGGGGGGGSGDASHKKLLARGCDPVMAERSKSMMPPLLGNVNFAATTEDDEFFALRACERARTATLAGGARGAPTGAHASPPRRPRRLTPQVPSSQLPRRSTM